MRSIEGPINDKILEANKVKELVIRALVQEGFLTQQKAQLFLEDYAVIQHAKGWLGRFFDSRLENSSDKFYRIVKKIR